jgi:cephalosporin-C deacetylase-like acetyl esterase
MNISPGSQRRTHPYDQTQSDDAGEAVFLTKIRSMLSGRSLYVKSGMSRREVLALAPLVCAGASSEHGAMMWDSFMRELDIADERRRKTLAAIRKKNELTQLQEKVRRVMHNGIGAFPERTPLNPQHAGEISRDDYIIEKIIFESRPDYYVTANLYRPKSTATRRPAVVQSCGHYEEGKTAEDYQRACIGLAKKGFVALIFDPMGQGERVMFRKPGEKRPGATSEHSLAGRPTLLVGRTLAHYRIWDVMRALDYLETRPDVDNTRMGMLGHSGGGMMTILTAPLEPRIRAAMSCCAVTSFYHKTKAHLMADPEQIVPGIYPNGVDHPEMIAAVAPRAFLIGAVLKDYVPLDGTRRTYQETKPIYEMLGEPGRFGKVESDNEHKLDQNLREACYGWMMKHLANESGDTREPPMQVESEENLWCTKTGSVMDLKKARSVFDLNLSYSHELAKRRSAKVHTDDVRALLGSPEPDPNIELPTTLIKGSTHPDVLVVMAADRGRNSIYAKELSHAFVNAGFSVLGVDLRGWGDTTPDTPKKQKFAWEEFFAWRAIELGRPLLGMRVGDLFAAVRKVAGEYRKIYAVGIGTAGLVALHAAALESSIAGVATVGTVGSYQDVMNHPVYTEPVSSFVWGALTRYDLPGLAAAIHPRPYIAADSQATAQEILKGLQLL